MKQLFAPFLLSFLAACHAPSASSVNAVTDADLLPDTVLSTDNAVGECSIEWTDEKIAAISKIDDRDRPLFVDLETFRSQAKAKIKAYFGETIEGKVFFQDTFSKNSEVTFDKAGLYYLVPIALIPADDFSLSTYYYSYSISTAGDVDVGFASTNGKSGKIYVDLEYPDLLLSFAGERGEEETDEEWKIKKDEAIKALEDFEAIAPSLNWEIRTVLNPWAQVSVNLTPSASETPVADQMREVGALFSAIAGSDLPFSIEMNKRAHEGGATNAPMLEIDESETTIDLNALRTETKAPFALEVPLNTLPSLAAPYGIGCRIYNPKVGLTPAGDQN